MTDRPTDDLRLGDGIPPEAWAAYCEHIVSFRDADDWKRHVTALSAALALSPDRAEIERLKTERDEYAQQISAHRMAAPVIIAERDSLAAKLAEAERERDEAREALKPFSEAGTATKNLLDWQGDHEVILSFGPAPIGVIPLSAFEAAREAYGHD